MSLHDQAFRLAQQGSEMRVSTCGSIAVMQDSAGVSIPPTFQCQFTRAVQNEELEAFGTSADIDLILRVPKTQTNFQPIEGKNVVIYAANDDASDLKIRLVTQHPHPFNPEYVFACKAIW